MKAYIAQAATPPAQTSQPDVWTTLAEKTGSENTAFNLADLRDRDRSKEK